MKKQNFLIKLKKEKKLELVGPSVEIQKSYSIKSDNCLRSAKILFDSDLYENSVSEAYYAMYNASLSLFFQCGIKCENHTATIILLEELFKLSDLKKNLETAKKERIDKQYHVSDKKNFEITKDAAKSMIQGAEDFILNLYAYMGRLSNDDIGQIRFRFSGF
ncbi:HEPN domain-containing protein [archaeon]|nr:HEPN domain-containing protein [archaeon]